MMCRLGGEPLLLQLGDMSMFCIGRPYETQCITTQCITPSVVMKSLGIGAFQKQTPNAHGGEGLSPQNPPATYIATFILETRLQVQNLGYRLPLDCHSSFARPAHTAFPIRTHTEVPAPRAGSLQAPPGAIFTKFREAINRDRKSGTPSGGRAGRRKRRTRAGRGREDVFGGLLRGWGVRQSKAVRE